MDTPGKKLLVGVAVTYLALVLLVPTLNVFVQAFAKGPGPFFGHLTDPDFLHAVRAVEPRCSGSDCSIPSHAHVLELCQLWSIGNAILQHMPVGSWDTASQRRAMTVFVHVAHAALALA